MYLLARDVDGYTTIVTYLHYFVPGRLKLESMSHQLRLDDLRDAVEASLIRSTRRWLQKGERPYPGYCREPGGKVCVPALCNCDKLREIWMNRLKKDIGKDCKS